MQIIKIKYLQRLPRTFLDAQELIQELVPTAELHTIMMSDPVGDWINIDDDCDLESMYRVANIAEQKIIKVQAEFIPVITQRVKAP